MGVSNKLANYTGKKQQQIYEGRLAIEILVHVLECEDAGLYAGKYMGQGMGVLEPAIFMTLKHWASP